MTRLGVRSLTRIIRIRVTRVNDVQNVSTHRACVPACARVYTKFKRLYKTIFKTRFSYTRAHTPKPLVQCH